MFFSNESHLFHSLPSTVLQSLLGAGLPQKTPPFFSAVCSFPPSSYSYDYVVSLRTTSFHLVLGFPTGILTYILSGSKYCPTLLEIVVLRYQIEILETLVCVIFALKFDPLLLLDALRPQMPPTVIARVSVIFAYFVLVLLWALWC